eukprot:CAMPEP_0178828824 /NCGR_PEP_ID=MMETSP0746-20121128/8040_1 /TAXON_ID=913974 /ORGANISM="Nitzschia punctata, Strain CCMP561" /LENGTH=467 /DNA_ID=CAMNT_0020490839 /DNA_START=75 /DNA_END=1478 /DNA_ORIENTATION=-
MMLSQDGSVKRVAPTRSSRSPSSDGPSPASELRYASQADLLATAAGVVKETSSLSRVFDAEMEEKIPKFSKSELLTGHVIGRGGFCVVMEIEKIQPKRKMSQKEAMAEISTLYDPKKGGANGKGSSMFRIFRRGNSSNSDADSVAASFKSIDTSTSNKLKRDERKLSRNYVINRAKATRSNRKCGYVVKAVSPDVDKITYMKGNVDIALEAKYLSALYHRNIIELAAVSSSRPCSKRYFLVLERMEETLTARLKSWMDRERMAQGIMACFGGAKKAEQLYTERIEASYDISSALYYLHTNKIIYRDLKPDNIGFDCHNVLKIFDFGLAKELLDEDKDASGRYRNMTAMTGAIRYMAPEVGTGKPYNLSADVYSWAMLMWFILALEPPFGLYTDNMIMDRAWVKGYRPVIFKRWSDTVKDVIKNAWHQDPLQRPSFLDISLSLKQELVDSTDDNKFVGSSSTSITSEQ